MARIGRRSRKSDAVYTGGFVSRLTSGMSSIPPPISECCVHKTCAYEIPGTRERGGGHRDTVQFESHGHNSSWLDRTARRQSASPEHPDCLSMVALSRGVHVEATTT